MVFSQLGLVEAWGTGLQRIRSAAREYGLLDPEFIETADMLRVNLYRKQVDDSDANDANRDANDANHNANDANSDANRLNENAETKIQNEIIRLLKANESLTQNELAQKIGVSRSTIQRMMKKWSREHAL